MKTIYFDNAATSFPKPKKVLYEVNNCIKNYCGNSGRSSHFLAMESSRRIYECREVLSDFLGLDQPENIIFTMNTTYALNILIKGLLRRGDHVLISDIEHNSVYRPIYKLHEDGIIDYDVFPSMCGNIAASPQRICAGIEKLIKPNTKLVICSQASNICSYSLPVGEIGAFCRKHGILLAVDAAQSAGHTRIDMRNMQIDALCAPAHKALYGIQGVGFLALSDNIPLDTIIEGGNGINSLDGQMPDLPPERFESGTLPTPGIVGLCNGIKEINRIGIDEIAEHEATLHNMLTERLLDIDNLTLYNPQYHGAVLLFNINNVPSEKTASALGDMGICTRGGFHCSALGHKTLQTPSNGAVRVSFGMFNTKTEVDEFFKAVKELSGQLK